jgi:hypothetical protein
MSRLLVPGARVDTPDHGPGAVIADWRTPVLGSVQPIRDTVWVLLDVGENPQPYTAADLQIPLEEMAA